MRQGAQQLFPLNGNGTDLVHHDSRCQVRELDRSLDLDIARHGERQDCDDRVAGPGNVVNLADDRRRVQSRVLAQYGNALVAHRHHHELHIQRTKLGLARGQQSIDISDRLAGSCRQFLQVGTNRSGAPIARKVSLLGIHQHGNPQLAGLRNDGAAHGFRQDTFRVIGEHNDISVGQRGGDALQQSCISSIRR